MNELKIWNYEENNMRTVELNGETWFVGKDVADILGYCNSRDALATHVDDEDKSNVAIHDGSQNRYMTVINESGVYALIFGSKLPDAKKFKHWVTHEVLPAIRKTGRYELPKNLSPTLQYLIELETRQNATQAQLDSFCETMAVNRDNWKDQCNKIVRKIAVKIYGDISMTFYIWDEAFQLLDKRAGVDTLRRLKNIKKRMKERGCKINDVRKINRFEVLNQDKKLLDIFITIVREMAIRYNV